MSAKDLFLERSLPSSVDAERSVLGSILLDNRLCNQAMERLKSGDWAGFGSEIGTMRSLLEDLGRQSGRH